MPKIIKVESCFVCPYCIYKNYGTIHCRIIGKLHKPDCNAKYPDWCPLDSVGWISVEDRLPPKDKRVLVWLWEKGEIDIDILRREGKSDGGGLQLIKNYLHNITFWMPLPAPPDTGKDW